MNRRITIEVTPGWSGINYKTENISHVEAIGIVVNLFASLVSQKTLSRIDELEEKLNLAIESNEQARKDKEAGIEKRITKKVAAGILGVCVKTLDNYIKRGHLPYYQFKGKILFKQSELLAFMDKQTKQIKDK